MKTRPHWVVFLPFLLPVTVFAAVALALWKVPAIESMQDQQFIVNYGPWIAFGGAAVVLAALMIVMKIVFRNAKLADIPDDKGDGEPG